MLQHRTIRRKEGLNQLFNVTNKTDRSRRGGGEKDQCQSFIPWE